MPAAWTSWSALQSLVAVLSVIYGIKRIAEDGWAIEHGAAIAFGIACTLSPSSAGNGRLPDPLIDAKLFQAPARSAALATNIAGRFVIFGCFLFIAQYLKLVLGMGPLEAGIRPRRRASSSRSAPGRAPVLVRHFRPATVITAGFIARQRVLPRRRTNLGALALDVARGHADLLHRRRRPSAPSRPTWPGPRRPRSGPSCFRHLETSFEFGGALAIAVLAAASHLHLSRRHGGPRPGRDSTGGHRSCERYARWRRRARRRSSGGDASARLLGKAREAFGLRVRGDGRDFSRRARCWPLLAATLLRRAGERSRDGN